jgi:HSF-type DNA-binding
MKRGSPTTTKGIDYPPYHDYALMPVDEVRAHFIQEEHQLTGSSATAVSSKVIAGRPPRKKFPIILYDALKEEDESCVQGFATSPSSMKDNQKFRWLDHGRAFTIGNRERFEQHILPKYFPTMRNYGSFQRQLNLYSYLRISFKTKCSTATYYHELFLRNRRDLCELIDRLGSSGQTRQRMNHQTEPDFFTFDPLPISSQASLNFASYPTEATESSAKHESLKRLTSFPPLLRDNEEFEDDLLEVHYRKLSTEYATQNLSNGSAGIVPSNRHNYEELDDDLEVHYKQLEQANPSAFHQLGYLNNVNDIKFSPSSSGSEPCTSGKNADVTNQKESHSP